MKYVQRALTAAALATLITGTAFAGERRDDPRGKDSLVIPGTYSLDVDTERLCGQESRATQDPRLSRYHIEFGADESECDVQWKQVDEKTRRLEPKNGALIYNFGNVAGVSEEDLRNADFLAKPIDGSDGEDGFPVLRRGTLIGVRTSEDTYLFRVLGYLQRETSRGTVVGYNLVLKKEISQ